MFAAGMGLGAGSGAALGWLIDRLHKRPAPRAVPALSIRADRQARAVRVAWTF
jgi:hypothetical protein